MAVTALGIQLPAETESEEQKIDVATTLVRNNHHCVSF